MSDHDQHNTEADNEEAADLNQSSTVDPKQSNVGQSEPLINKKPDQSPSRDLNQSSTEEMNQSPTKDPKQSGAQEDTSPSKESKQMASKDANTSAQSHSETSDQSADQKSLETTESVLEEESELFDDLDVSGGASQMSPALDETGASNPETDEETHIVAADSGAHHVTDETAESQTTAPKSPDRKGESSRCAGAGDHQNVPLGAPPVCKPSPTAEKESAKDVRFAAEISTSMPIVPIIIIQSRADSPEKDSSDESEAKPVAEGPSSGQSREAAPVEREPHREENKTADAEGSRRPVEQKTTEKPKVKSKQEKRDVRTDSEKDATRESAAKTAEGDSVKEEAVLPKQKEPLFTVGEIEPFHTSPRKESPKKTKKSRSQRTHSPKRSEALVEKPARDSPKTRRKKMPRMKERKGHDIAQSETAEMSRPVGGQAEIREAVGFHVSGRHDSQSREAGGRRDQETMTSSHRPVLVRRERETFHVVARTSLRARNLKVWQTLKKLTCIGQMANSSDFDRIQNSRTDFLYSFVEFMTNLGVEGTGVILGRSAVYRLDLFLANVLKTILSSSRTVRRTCIFRGVLLLISDFWHSWVGRPIIATTAFFANSAQQLLGGLDELYVTLGLTAVEGERQLPWRKRVQEQGLIKLAIRASCFPTWVYVFFLVLVLNFIHSTQLFFRDTVVARIRSRKRRLQNLPAPRREDDQEDIRSFTSRCRERRGDGDGPGDPGGAESGRLHRQGGGEGKEFDRPDVRRESGESRDRQHLEEPSRGEGRHSGGSKVAGYALERASSHSTERRQRSGERRRQTDTGSDTRRERPDSGKRHSREDNRMKRMSSQRGTEKDTEDKQRNQLPYQHEARHQDPRNKGRIDPKWRETRGIYRGHCGTRWQQYEGLPSSYYSEPPKARTSKGRAIRGRTDESETNSDIGRHSVREREYEYTLKPNHAIAEIRPIKKQDRHHYRQPGVGRTSPDLQQCDEECCPTIATRGSTSAVPKRAAFLKGEKKTTEILKAQMAKAMTSRLKADRTSTPQKHDPDSERKHTRRKRQPIFEREDEEDDTDDDEAFIDLEVLSSDNDFDDFDPMTITFNKDARTVAVPREDEGKASSHYFRLERPVKQEARGSCGSDEEEASMSKPREREGRQSKGSRSKVSFRSEILHKLPKDASAQADYGDENNKAIRRLVAGADRRITPVKRRLRGVRRLTSPPPFRFLVPPTSFESSKFENLSVGNQLLCLIRRMPFLSDIVRDPRDPPPVAYLYDVPTVITDDETRRLLEMAPPRRKSIESKRKLSDVYSEDSSDDPDYQPDVLDTTDPLEYTEADAAGVSDEEKENQATHTVDVEVHEEPGQGRGRCSSRADDDGSERESYDDEGQDSDVNDSSDENDG